MLLFVQTARGSGDHSRSALWHPCLHVRAFLSASACTRVRSKAAPFKSRCKTRLFFCPKSPLGERRQLRFSLCLQFCRLLLPLLLPAGASRPRKRERRRVTKDIFREQEDNPASVPQPEQSSPSRPMPGQSPVIHCHLQSLYTSSAALPPGMVSQVLSLRAKDVTESIRFQ